MKATGIVRKVDELGRIVLPVELRRTLDITPNDSVEIFVDGGNIVLSKHRASCAFCDGVTDIILFKERNICRKCLTEISAMEI